MATITSRTSGDVTILDVAGKVTAGDGSGAVQSAVQDALNGGATKIVLNGAWTTIDSSGIGECIASHAQAADRGAQLKVVAPPSTASDALHITQLNKVLEVHDNEAQAVASFA
jgi:anti-sigma B factor antagonist